MSSTNIASNFFKVRLLLSTKRDFLVISGKSNYLKARMNWRMDCYLKLKFFSLAYLPFAYLIIHLFIHQALTENTQCAPSELGAGFWERKKGKSDNLWNRTLGPGVLARPQIRTAGRRGVCSWGREMGADTTKQTKANRIISVPIRGDFLWGRSQYKCNEIRTWRAKDRTRGIYLKRCWGEGWKWDDESWD